MSIPADTRIEGIYIYTPLITVIIFLYHILVNRELCEVVFTCCLHVQHFHFPKI